MTTENSKETKATNTAIEFGEAVEALRQGKKVARLGWKGGMYLYLIQGHPVNGYLQPGSPQSQTNEAKHEGGQMLDYIVMKTADASIYWGDGYSDYTVWSPSQSDVMASDWVIKN